MVEFRAPQPSAIAMNRTLAPDCRDGPRGCVPPHRDAVIERTACRLRELVVASTMELTLSVGEIIVDELYDGSFEAWRTRGRKCTSLRALARRPDLTMSATALYRCIAIYELVRRSGGIQAFSRLRVSHYRAVLGLPSDKQIEYLQIANDEAWTATELDERTRRARPVVPLRRGGRRRMNSIHRAVRAAVRALDGDGFERPAVEGLVGGPDLEAARSELDGLLAQVVELARVLGVDVPQRAHAATSEPAYPRRA
jgi:hypothetical protein